MKTVLFTFGNAQICILEICCDTTHLLGQLEEKTDVYKDDCLKISSTKRLREFIAVRIALHSLTGKWIKIFYTDEGKPYSQEESIHISISHSKDFIAVMIHPSTRIGIDIEIPTEKITKIYTRFLSLTEQQDFCTTKNSTFLQLAWSAKEALYKIIGREAVDFANQLRLFPFELNTKGIMHAEHIPSQKKYTLQYIHTPQYNLVYCVECEVA